MIVLLAGVRPYFAQGLHNLHFAAWLPAERIFPEEEQIYSATLKAVRQAHVLLGKNGRPTRAGGTEPGPEEPAFFYRV